MSRSEADLVAARTADLPPIDLPPRGGARRDGNPYQVQTTPSPSSSSQASRYNVTQTLDSPTVPNPIRPRAQSPPAINNQPQQQTTQFVPTAENEVRQFNPGSAIRAAGDKVSQEVCKIKTRMDAAYDKRTSVSYGMLAIGGATAILAGTGLVAALIAGNHKSANSERRNNHTLLAVAFGAVLVIGGIIVYKQYQKIRDTKAARRDHQQSIYDYNRALNAQSSQQQVPSYGN